MNMKLKPSSALDRNMMRLWHDAVWVKCLGKCVIKSEKCSGSLECDHYKTRSEYLLRFDWRNGALLCNYHHREKTQYKEEIETYFGIERVEYLNYVFNTHDGDYLAYELGMDAQEYYKSQKIELQEIIQKHFDNE